MRVTGLRTANSTTRLRCRTAVNYSTNLVRPVKKTLAMRSISHVAACRVEVALWHRAPGVGFQEH